MMNHSDWREAQTSIFFSSFNTSCALWAELATAWSFLYTFCYSTVGILVLYPETVPPQEGVPGGLSQDEPL